MVSDFFSGFSNKALAVTGPIQCTSKKNEYPFWQNPLGFWKVQVEFMASQGDAPSSGEKAPPKAKQMLLTDKIGKYLADTIHADLESDSPQYSKAIEAPRTRGRPEAMLKLVNMLHESSLDDCAGRKTTVDTVTEWINKLRQAGIDHNKALITDREAGRSGEPPAEHVRLWADLMQALVDKADQHVKTTRYNFIPEHLKGKVAFIKCNTAFLPDPRSVGHGFGRNDQSDAIEAVQKRKREMSVDTVSDNEAEGGAGGSGVKPKKHLQPSPRVNMEGNNAARTELAQAMVSLIKLKQEKAESDKLKQESVRTDAIYAQIQRNMEFLSMPNIPPQIRANCESMIVSLQAQLMQPQQQPPIQAAYFNPVVATFTTPPRASGGAGGDDDVGILSP